MRVTSILLSLLVAGPVSAQMPASFIQNFSDYQSEAGHFKGSASVRPPAATIPILARPFSGEYSWDSVQISGDGKRIQVKHPHQKYSRDKRGRTRIEVLGSKEAPDSPVAIELNDPVAGSYFFLDTINKVAHSYKYEPSRVRMAVDPILPPDTPVMAGAKQSTSRLGSRVIEGVIVEGTLITTEYPQSPGSTSPKLIRTHESWVSENLRVWLVFQVVDPILGDHLYQAVSFATAEPDGALFVPPPGYRIVKESRPTAVSWGGGSPISAPVALVKPEPNYSKAGEKAHIQGEILVSVVVTEKGLPTNIKVVKGLGYGLDEEAVKAVQQWRFQPGLQDGKPVAVQATIGISFRLF